MQHDNKLKNLADFRRIQADKRAKLKLSDIGCRNCRFMIHQRMTPTDITGVPVCRFGPPAMTQFPTPNGLQVLVQWPPVAMPDAWCYQFEPSDDCTAGALLPAE
jgi:hypothetical protein